jgi:hypothetical protein
MDTEGLLVALKKGLKVRYDAHMEIVRRLELICASFNEIVGKVVAPKIEMKVYIFPADKLQRPIPRIFMAQERNVGVIFAAEFVLESDKFFQGILVHTLEDIRIVNGSQAQKVIITQISEILKNDPRLHDTISYMNSDGFGHLWKDPIAEAQKRIIKENERRLDDESSGENWKV